MTSTPHDALFKTVFQHPENAAAELAHLLAPEWSTLALEPGTYVDRKLAEKRSDEPLPLIIPAVLSHAPDGWQAPTRFSALFSPNLGSLADVVLPDFAYAVDDLHRTSDADLRRRTLALQARLALWLMRDARDAAQLLRRLLHWLPDIERLAQLPGGLQALEPLIRYIALISPDLQLEQIRAILEDRAPIAEGITMTIAEQLRAEGEARGEAKGRAEGKAEGKAEAIVLVLRSRGLHVDAQFQARIAAMSLEDLDASLQRAATVTSADELLEG